MVERLLYTQEVTGSSPVRSTIAFPTQKVGIFLCVILSFSDGEFLVVSSVTILECFILGGRAR